MCSGHVTFPHIPHSQPANDYSNNLQVPAVFCGQNDTPEVSSGMGMPESFDSFVARCKACRTSKCIILPRSAHERRGLLATLHRSGLHQPFPAPPSCCSASRHWSASIASPTAPATMPSADFCDAIGSPLGSPSPDSGTRRRPPRVSLTAFPAHLPDLHPLP